jgi:cytochrome c biogenesis protein CcmG, thiol:disulfide interchange protein DsbE
MRRALPILAAAVLAAVLVIGLTQAGGGSDEGSAEPFDLAEAKDRLRGAPAPLAALHAQSGQILGGGRTAFTERLRALQGHPVVVNKWASWCGPCRSEFPYFQALATERGKEIGFLGLNSGDVRPAAERFLAEFPVPFPSYEDADEAIARSLEGAKNYPVTIFFDARGKPAFIHQGSYRSRTDLAADIDRYATG